MMIFICPACGPVRADDPTQHEQTEYHQYITSLLARYYDLTHYKLVAA